MMPEAGTEDAEVVRLKKRLAFSAVTLVICFILSACIQITIPAVHISQLPPSQSLKPSPTPAASPLVPMTGREKEALSYFSEIALKSEYGGQSYEGIVRRWEQPLTVEIRGQPAAADLATLDAHIALLRQTAGSLDISVAQQAGSGNFVVYFVPLDDLDDVVPGYVEGNWGFVNISWDDHARIQQATVGIATDVTDQKQRNHLILEEVTQGLGLLNDSPLYQDSIFQIEWTETQKLSDMDLWVVAMLYSPVIKAGMGRAETESALSDWFSSPK
jgi:hypothetical protein